MGRTPRKYPLYMLASAPLLEGERILEEERERIRLEELNQPKLSKKPPLQEPDDEIEVDLFFRKQLPVGTLEEQLKAILQVSPGANADVVRDLLNQCPKPIEYTEALLGKMTSRARYVRDLILTKGWASSSEIGQKYVEVGRPITELEKEAGVSLTHQSGRGGEGMVYRFDPEGFVKRLGERDFYLARYRDILGKTCSTCPSEAARALQVDHRIPYSHVGNDVVRVEGEAALQPLCPSCNTRKNRACTDCTLKNPEECRSCYWAYPKSYTHIAGDRRKQLTLMIEGPVADILRKYTASKGSTLEDFISKAIQDFHTVASERLGKK